MPNRARSKQKRTRGKILSVLASARGVDEREILRILKKTIRGMRLEQTKSAGEDDILRSENLPNGWEKHLLVRRPEGIATASATTRPFFGGVIVENLHVPRPFRKKGLARQLLAGVLDKYADGNRFIRPGAFGDKPMSTEQLRRFYSKFGFNRIPGTDIMRMQKSAIWPFSEVGTAIAGEPMEKKPVEQIAPKKKAPPPAPPPAPLTAPPYRYGLLGWFGGGAKTPTFDPASRRRLWGKPEVQAPGVRDVIVKARRMEELERKGYTPQQAYHEIYVAPHMAKSQEHAASMGALRKQATLSSILQHPVTLPILGGLTGATGGGLLSKHFLGRYLPGVAVGGAVGAGLPIGIRYLLERRRPGGTEEKKERRKTYDETIGIDRVYDEYFENGRPKGLMRTYLRRERRRIDEMPEGAKKKSALHDWEIALRNTLSAQKPLRDAHAAMQTEGAPATRRRLDAELAAILELPESRKRDQSLEEWHRKDTEFTRAVARPARLEDPLVAQYKTEYARMLIGLLGGRAPTGLPVAEELRERYPGYHFPDLIGRTPVTLPGGKQPVQLLEDLMTGEVELPWTTRVALGVMQKKYPETYQSIMDLNELLLGAHTLLYDPSGAPMYGFPEPGVAGYAPEEDWRLAPLPRVLEPLKR